MALTSGDLPSKLSRAIRAYLISQGVAQPTQCFAQPNSSDHTLPATEIESGEGGEQHYEGGNYEFNVEVRLFDDAVDDPAAPRATENAAIKRFTDTWNALNLSNDGVTLDLTAQNITAAAQAAAVAAPVNDGDLSDFTLIKMWADGIGDRFKDAAGTFWVQSGRFRCVCCNSYIP